MKPLSLPALGIASIFLITGPVMPAQDNTATDRIDRTRLPIVEADSPPIEILDWTRGMQPHRRDSR
jgi:hypothetical protein